MLTVNKNLIQGKIRIAGLTQRELAQKIGLSENTLCNRINGYSYFNTREIDAICEVLNISDDSEKILIFLSKTSQKRDAPRPIDVETDRSA